MNAVLEILINDASRLSSDLDAWANKIMAHRNDHGVYPRYGDDLAANRAKLLAQRIKDAVAEATYADDEPDEAWFGGRPGSLVRRYCVPPWTWIAETTKGGRHIERQGPTIADAIRALRAAVEGGGQ